MDGTERENFREPEETHLETRLRESEEKYRMLFEHNVDATFLTFGDGRVIAANPAAQLMFGMTEAEICAAGQEGLLDTTDPRLGAALEERSRTGKAAALLRARRKDGSMIPVEVQSTLLLDGTGRAIVTARDISLRLQTEGALRQSEQRFRILAGATSEGVAVYERGLLLYCNDRFAQLFGYSPEEVVGMQACAFVAPEARDQAVRLSQSGFAEPYESTAIRADGSTFPVEFQGTSINDSLRVGLVRDLTRQKLAEQALKRKEEQFRALVTASSQVIYRMSPDWSEMRQLSSPGLLAVTEKPRLTWLQEYIPPEDQPEVTEVIAKAINTKGTFELEHRVRLADGSIGWVASRAVPVLDDAGEILEWFGAARDITKRKLTEANSNALAKRQERAKSRKKILAYQERLRVLASKLSLAQEEERRRIAVEVHDSIGQNLAYCKLRLGEFQLRHREASNALVSVLDTLDRSISSVRSLSFELSPAALFDIGLEPALQWLAKNYALRHNLRVTVNATTPAKIPLVSRIILFQATRELLANVAKHARTKEAEIWLSQTSRSLSVTVRDHGVGFAVPGDGALPESANGFGLFNVQEQLANAGGRLIITSTPGGGTTAEAVVSLKQTRARK